MLEKLNINEIENGLIPKKFLESWKKNKVIHISGIDKNIAENKNSLRSFYENFVNDIGEIFYLAEDANIKERGSQRTGEAWSEIRYNPEIKNAYRHSSNPQPLHTDGSYIPSFPDASIMYCVKNSDKGGETIFIDKEAFLEILEKDVPILKKQLMETEVVHERSGDKKISSIIEERNGDIFLHWNYYCVNKENSEIKEMIESLFDFLGNNKAIKNNLIEVHLKPGECVIWKDSETLHGRNGFEAKNASERYLYKSAFKVKK